jgi:hypothetical protein
VHVDSAIVNQLRLRDVDVLRAQDDGTDTLTDELLLEHATALGRPLVTNDIRFHAMARKWQEQAIPFCGIIFAHQMQVSIGQCVRDLEIIAKATDPDEWNRSILRLPL